MRTLGVWGDSACGAAADGVCACGGRRDDRADRRSARARRHLRHERSGYRGQGEWTVRSWNASEIAVIDFAGDGNNFPQQRTRPRGHGPARPAQRVARCQGGLVDIGGSNPLKRIYFTTGHDYSSNDVARIYFSPTPRSATALPAAAGCPGGRDHPCSRRNGGWVSTGITVFQGEAGHLATTGEVRLSADPNDIATTAGSKVGRYAPRSPLPSEPPAP